MKCRGTSGIDWYCFLLFLIGENSSLLFLFGALVSHTNYHHFMISFFIFVGMIFKVFCVCMKLDFLGDCYLDELQLKVVKTEDIKSYTYEKEN